MTRRSLDSLVGGSDSTNDRLLARWKGEGDRSAAGYRTLTRWFNKQVLKRAYRDHGRDAVASQLDSDLELLTDGDELERLEFEEHLSSTGIDVEALRDDFISWSTMRNHLKDCLNGDKRTESSSSGWEQRSVEIAKEKVEEKTEAAVRTLESKRELVGGTDADMTVQVLLECPDCQTRVSFETAKERGYVCRTHLPAAEREPVTATADGRDEVTGEVIPHWTSNDEVDQAPCFGI